MNILMFGWEYMPAVSGGLGVACTGLSEALAKKHQVTFIVPRVEAPRVEAPGVEAPGSEVSASVTLKDPDPIAKSQVRVVEVSKEQVPPLESFSSEQVQHLRISTQLLPYLPPLTGFAGEDREITTELLETVDLTGEYGEQLSAEVVKYAVLAKNKYGEQNFDIIHAHDWMGLQAGLVARSELQVPLVAHIHSTEWERNSYHSNPDLLETEKQGLIAADHIICVSEITARIIEERYGLSSEKISVIPNATDWKEVPSGRKAKRFFTLGYAGRFTEQKSPQQFVDLARLLESRRPGEFNFIMAGEGYLLEKCQRQVTALNLSDKFTFTGFLEPDKLRQVYQRMDLLLIPSRAEPFGLVALEALACRVPVIATCTTGAAANLQLQTYSSWNLHQALQLVLDIADHPEDTKKYLAATRKEAKKLSWQSSADMVEAVYNKLL